jgi:integrase
VLGGPYTSTQTTYDLRRLRLNGLIRRLPGQNRYMVTPDGVRVATFYTKIHRRLLQPLLDADKPPAPIELRRTEVGPTKSYARRTVGLPRSICDDLGEFLTRRSRERGCPPSPDDYVFTAPRGGPLRRDLLLKRFIRPPAEAAGLPAGLRLHDLRHTSVSLLIELGAHPKVIQERLGHSSITVTTDVYGHLFPSLAESLTERLDEVFQEVRASHVDADPAPVVALR